MSKGDTRLQRNTDRLIAKLIESIVPADAQTDLGLQAPSPSQPRAARSNYSTLNASSHNLFHFIQHLFREVRCNNTLPILLVLLLHFSIPIRLPIQSQFPPVLPYLLRLPFPPRQPFAQQPPPLLHHGASLLVFLNAILLVEIFAVLA